MALQRTFVGIDISKDWLDIWFETDRRLERIGNDRAGWTELIALLGQAGPVVPAVAFEATGGYENGLREALLTAGIETHRVNPRSVRLFARSLGRHAKNDRIDACMIARFARTAETMPETLDPARERLAELVSQRRSLIDERTAVSNRTATLRQALLVEQNRQRLALIERQIAAVDTLIAEAVGTDPTLCDRARLLQTVKGVKQIVANTLVALLPELGRLNRRAIAALVGLAPFDHDNGKRRGTRSISGGRAPVRTALYMAARAAALSKSPLGTFYKHLKDQGKSNKTATVALMRKILVTLNAIVRDNEPWKHAKKTA